MNLAQVLRGDGGDSVAMLAQLERFERLAQQSVDERDAYKIARYFHDCQPGCKPTLNPKDHVPLPGNDAPTCRMLYVKALKYMAAGAHYPERLFLAANRIGKALKNGTVVATPKGWTAIEHLKVGDKVIAGNGFVTRVTGVYPQGKKPLLRFTFDCGEQIECCTEHLWKYQHPRARYPYRQSHGKREPNPFNGEWSVETAATILKQVGSAPITRMRAVVPTSEPWQLPAVDVPLDPYLLGVLLGDGGLTQGVKLSSVDREILDAVSASLPLGCALTKYPSDRSCDWAIVGTSRGKNPVWSTLKALCLAGSRSSQKHIPRLYRNNSASVRLAMLQGLMDTDGSISKSGAMEFSTTSMQLALDVEHLVYSLGGKCRKEVRQTYCTSRGIRTAGAPSVRLKIRLNICPFRLSRKAKRWNTRKNTPNRVVHRIEPAGVDDCTCITVEHPSHTYVTAHGIVTHNTETAAFELTAHLTGYYPKWWVGKKFDRPTDWRAAGDTMLTTRDIIQNALLGHHEGVPQKEWRGMIPPRLIVDVTRKSGGVSNCVDTIFIEHAEKVHGAPGISRLSLLSYDMGRRVFQGFECDGIWLDEEPPDPQEKAEAQAMGSSEIYTECLLRTMTRSGILLATFTPLRGMTPFLHHYFETAMMPGTEEDEDLEVPAKVYYLRSKDADADAAQEDLPASTTVEVNPYGHVTPRFVVGATWDDAPHLSEDAKAKQWASILPYQRAARSKGLPQLGAGAIYPISDDDLRVKDIPIPDHWKRGYAMDCGGGSKPTAAVFGAFDPDARILYITSVYKSAALEPAIHATAIKSRFGNWKWAGVADAAALILTEHDAEQLVYTYKNKHGLDIELPDKSVEAGIVNVWDAMTTGRFKVFASCVAWFQELAMYRRDKHGRIVKQNDHLMDASRYLVRSGVARMKSKPAEKKEREVFSVDEASLGLGWMRG